jgi:hypothetical protein
MFACAWKDTKPVHMIGTGVSTDIIQINRKRRDGTVGKYSCLAATKSYHQFMGGVDSHDFMRMAQFSVQKAFRFRKWYKQAYLGLFDIALVNCYILHRMLFHDTAQKLSHGDFREKLGTALLNKNFTNDRRGRRVNRNLTEDLLSCGNDHEMREYRRGEGYTGRQQKYKRCWVCSQVGKVKTTKHYCTTCMVAVCFGEAVDGTYRSCWLELHHNESLRERAKRRGEQITNQRKKNSRNTSICL